MHQMTMALLFGIMLMACDTGLVLTGQPEAQNKEGIAENEVQPLDLIPMNAEQLVGQLEKPWAPDVELVPGDGSSQQPGSSIPHLKSLTAVPTIVKGGDRVVFRVQLGGNWRNLQSPITVHINLSVLNFPQVVPMRNDGLEGDEVANDDIFTLVFQVPEDAESNTLKIYAAGSSGNLSLGIAVNLLSIVGGDFQSRHGFEGVDCPLDKPFVFPELPEEADKTRGVNLKDGLWTLKDGWVNEEAAVEGQFGLTLVAKGILISRWYANGSRLSFLVKNNGLMAELELSWSRDGVNWTPLMYEKEITPKNYLRFKANLPENFHGYIRWKSLSGHPIHLDQFRVWKKTAPLVQ